MKNQIVTQENALMAIVDNAMSNPNVDIEKMNSILDMQERIMNKNAEVSFNKSMVGAISAIPSFEKSTSGHNYKYATFEQINKVVKPILKEHDLFVTFLTDFQSDNFVLVTAEITHKDGYSKKTSMRFPFDTSGSKNQVQAVASAISYGKRYMQNALLNITTHGEDDDGFATEKTIGAKEIERLNAGITKSGISLAEYNKAMSVTSLGEIKHVDFAEAIGFLINLVKVKKDAS
jgi:hypothetical protein